MARDTINAPDAGLPAVDLPASFQPKSSKATASRVLGLMSLFLFPVAPVTGPLAIVLGVVGLAEMARTRRRLGGRSAAFIGIATGLIGLAVFGASAWATLGWLGKSATTHVVEEQLRHNPILVKHLGTIPEGAFKLDWLASARVNLESWLYRVKGTSGEATVIAETFVDQKGAMTVIGAHLRLPSGENIDLLPPEEDDSQLYDPQ
jgi:hypothetical protein